jgi:hypothetical protein
MVPIRNRTALAVTFGVWIAALGSAAALTYDLNRTPHLTGVTSQPKMPTTTAPPVVVPAASELQPVLSVPTITIVGSIRRSVANAPKPERAVDISQMHCADWRGLDIGSGHVRVCE